MAGLTKTYTRDLTTAIAGKLWEAIKDADEKHNLEKSKASKEVKEAAVELKKEDPDSIPVQDKDLGEKFVKIFGPLEGKLLQTEGKVDKLSGKITAVAGGIADTQKLIINQNQILEDKFDQMLEIFTNNSVLKGRKSSKDKFKQLELNLEEGNDLSSTFSFEKVGKGGRGGGRGLLEFLLRRAGSTALKKIARRLIPKRLQVRARQIRRIPSKVRGNLVKNFTKLIPGAAGRKIRNVVGKEVVEGAAKRQIKKQLVKQGGKVASKKIPGLGWIAGSIFALERALKGDMEGAALEFASGLAGSIPTVGTATSLGIDAYIIKRDIEKSIAPQYERGNIELKPSGGVSGIADSISEIIGVTKAFGDSTGFGPEVKGLIGEAGLSSYPISKGDYTFDVVGTLGGGGNIDNSKNKEAELRKKEKPSKEEVTKDDDRTSGEKVGDIIGETIDEVDRFVDPVRKFTGGKRDDGKITLPFGIEFRNPFNTKPKGGGGIGGDDSVKSVSPIMGGSGATIEFHGQQGRDLSGEPGVDFSYKDYKSNYNLFPGYVLETGLLYGSRYGNVVVVRSVDPSNGLEFDSLYSHFPDGGIAVQPGQIVSAEQYLGKVGFVSVDTPGVPQMQPNNAGNMSGWHTSVDFFEPGSSARYRNLNTIQNLVTGANGQTPGRLLEKLKPSSTGDDQSSLNSIEANSKLASTMTGMVEKGSSERLVSKRQNSKKLPIVIINNQVLKTNSTNISTGGNNKKDDFFEAYNLARHTV